MVISKTGKSPLGVYYKSPLGVRSRSSKINLLVMIFCSSIREENLGNTYPVYNNIWDGNFATNLSSLRTVIAEHEASRVCLIGIKRENAYNEVSSASYTTGIDMCYPDSWINSDNDMPNWIHTEEWTASGDCGGPLGNSITEYDLMDWFENSVAKFGMPTQVRIGCANDSGSMLYDVRQRRVSPWAIYPTVNLTNGLPPVPGGGGEDNYYNLIQEDGDISGFQACVDFYEYLESPEVGINALPRNEGYFCRVADTPDGLIIDGAEAGWMGFFSGSISAYVPAL